MKEELVTIIAPAYNHEKYVKDAFDSIWNSYDNVYEAFSIIGFPKKEIWIEETYLKGLENVDSIELKTEEKIPFERGSWNPVSKTLELVNWKDEWSWSYSYEDFLSTIIHETMHVTQKIDWSSDEMWNMSYAYIEGRSIFC